MSDQASSAVRVAKEHAASAQAALDVALAARREALPVATINEAAEHLDQVLILLGETDDYTTRTARWTR